MKSRRGVRLPTAPPTRKHGDENRYRRNREKAQNWHDYLDATIDDLQEEREMMEYWEAQEMLDEIAENRADREKVDDDYADERWADDGGAQAVEGHIKEEVSEGV